MGIPERVEIKRLAGIFWECLTCELDEYILHIYYSFSETDGLSQVDNPAIFTTLIRKNFTR